MSSFLAFTATEDDIRRVRQTVSPDVDLALLADAYKDVQLLHQTTKSTAKLRDFLPTLCNKSENIGQDDCEVTSLAITLSHILVCKPQSADCERLISAYNHLKTDARPTLECKTINDYLYILLNMPPLAQYDPRPAILYWLQDKQRRQKATPKASQQKLLRNVFGDIDEHIAEDTEKQKLMR